MKNQLVKLEQMGESHKNFATVYANSMSSCTAICQQNNELFAAAALLPSPIIDQWSELVEAGKFEAEKALVTCKNWSAIVSSPAYRVKTIDQCFDNDSPSLATMKKYQSEMMPIVTLSVLIGNVCDFFNVGGNMSDIQIKETAFLVLESYYWLTIKDFVLCFTMAKKGDFGKVYDRLDGQLILEWIKQYNELRIQTAQLNATKKAAQEKELAKQMHPAVVEVLKKIVPKEQPKPQFLSESDFEKKRREQQELLLNTFNQQKLQQDD